MTIATAFLYRAIAKDPILIARVGGIPYVLRAVAIVNLVVLLVIAQLAPWNDSRLAERARFDVGSDVC